MNSGQAVSALGFIFLGIWSLTTGAQSQRLGGPIEFIQQNYGIAALSAMGFLATFFPGISKVVEDLKSGKKTPQSAGGWLSWILGMTGSKSLGFAGQVIGLVEAAIADSDHRPNYFEGKLHWDNGTVTPLVIGRQPTAATVQQVAPTPPASAPQPKPLVVTPAPQPVTPGAAQ